MKSRYQALLQERADLVAEGRGIFAAAEEGEGRDLTDDERKRDDAIHARLEELESEIQRHERQRDREGLVASPPIIDTGFGAGDTADLPKPRPFKSFGEQLQAVAAAASGSGRIDPRLQLVNDEGRIMAQTGMGEGIPSDGGFLVQIDFSTELLRRTYESGLVAGRCRRIPISANANGLKINGINETSRAEGSRWGGVLAYWKAEAAAKYATHPEFRQIELNLKKLTGLCYATDELLQDASALEAVIMAAFSEEFAFKIDDAIIEGTGAGMPLGILNSGAIVIQAKEGGQVARTVVPQNIVQMWSRLDPRSKANSVWLINTDVTPQLYGMSLAVGTGGGPVFMPPGGLSAAPYGTLMNRPVIEIEQCSTLGTQGDIILADLSQYLLIDKGGMEAASSIHLRFNYDETCFRFVYRVDGQPTWAAPLTPFHDAATTRPISPFVVLAVRA